MGELREYLKDRLPDYMVPTAYEMLESFPLTPNGKLDRRALPAPRLEVSNAFAPPRSNMELQIAHIWENVLGRHPIGINQNFFELGGHSILAMRIIAKIQQEFDRELPLASMLEAPTVEDFARLMNRYKVSVPWSTLVRIQPRGRGLPFFCIHPIGGNVLCYYDLALNLGDDHPFIGIQARDLVELGEHSTSIQGMAADYITAIRNEQPQGPYFIGGYSLGGHIAFEMAQQLLQQGEEVGALVLFDTWAPDIFKKLPLGSDDTQLLANLAMDYVLGAGKKLVIDAAELRGLSEDEQLATVLQMLKEVGVVPREISVNQVKRLFQGWKSRYYALLQYSAQKYAARITLLRATDIDQERAELFSSRGIDVSDPAIGWGVIAELPVDVYPVPGYHETMLQKPNVTASSQILADVLNSHQVWRESCN